MNKNDLIDAVAERTGLAKSDATRAVDAVFATITEALQKGDTVALVGLRHVRGRSTRRAHRPQSAHRRDDRDSREPRTGLQGWQGPEGCRKLAGSQRGTGA